MRKDLSGTDLENATGVKKNHWVSVLWGFTVFFCVRILMDPVLYGIFFSEAPAGIGFKALLPLSFEHSILCTAVIAAALIAETGRKPFERLFCFFCGTALAAGYSIECRGSFF